MRRSLLIGSAGLLMLTAVQAQTPQELRGPGSFAGISDTQARSRALFSEAARVLTHPRCLNCHPAGDVPTQGNDRHAHRPPVVRGEAGGGTPGNTCAACHTQANYTLLEPSSYRSIPGHPRWAVAPIEMAWQGKTVGEICQQIKDPERNGGRTLELVHEHMAKDDLVAWGWDPGAGREPAPGNQQILGELINAWMDTGAVCP
ncbi:MAG: Isoquinoline 1-oxidoreductase subunit [Xanthobacteraceae bacterium]